MTTRSAMRPDLHNRLLKLDALTPKYQAVMASVSTQSRRVLVALAECGPESLARNVGEAARLDVHTTSMVLGRLAEDGHVVSLARSARVSVYSFADPDLAEWLLARRNPRAVR
jgi:DNA-binding MarR family transcriptional regulator